VPIVGTLSSLAGFTASTGPLLTGRPVFFSKLASHLPPL
jgi:hypothetical protein